MGILFSSRERLRLSKQRRQLKEEPRPHGLAQLARAYLAMGDGTVAREVLEFGRSLFPESEELNRVRVLFVSGEKQSRLSSVKEQARKTGTAQAYLELAHAYQQTGNQEQQISTLRQMLELFGENCSALAQLGYIRFSRFLSNLATSDALAAKSLLQRAVASDVEALKPRFVLADLFFRVGAVQRAEQVLAGLLELSPGHERALQMRAELDAIPPEDRDPMEDFRSLLGQVEESTRLMHAAPPWETHLQVEAEVRELVEEPEVEVKRLAEQTGAREALAFDSEATLANQNASSDLAQLSRSLSALCQRTARGMQLGAPACLVVEGTSGSLVLEFKHETVMSLVLGREIDARSAAVAARDSLERLSRGPR